MLADMTAPCRDRPMSTPADLSAAIPRRMGHQLVKEHSVAGVRAVWEGMGSMGGAIERHRVVKVEL